MGLLSELDYEVKSANLIQKGVQRMAATSPVAWAFSKTLFPVDRALHKVSKGKVTVPGLMAGLPVIMFTTTGAKSGKERTMPLLGIPVGENLAVVGSNYGQKSTPGWVYNLEADSAAVVGYQDKSVAVTARHASEQESDEVFELATAVYGAFPKYRERADHREIRVFVLEPAS